jgi:hypothetical protein
MSITSRDIKTAGIVIPAMSATGTFGTPGDASGSEDELTRARRCARLVLAALWLVFLAGTLMLWTADAALAVMVLLVGVSTILESVHGALGLERLRRRLWHRTA